MMQWFMQLLFGAKRMPLNEKLKQIISMDRKNRRIF